MFRAVGLRSPLLSPAWTGAWRRMFLSETKRSLLINLESQQRAGLHMLRNIPRQSANRSGGPFTRTQCRGFRFSSWRRNTTQNGTQEKLTLSQRLKRLSKEYGWSAVGVYLALSVLDFPFCFLLVRIVGTDTIGKIEHYVVSTVKRFIPESVRQKWHEYWQSIKSKEVETMGNDNISDKVEMAGWGVEEAQERNKEEASLGTQLALAYAIHKSFIFLRVPLTAAITPKVVKVLRSWGWNIGKRVSR
ncbi:peptide alpha-N-acetyltransferase [Metarhizium guizhouense ARSEF 977]|uniref:Peptide alpha-N-acetyltransferase n=1 Tax=Metarhizium guizhouense (strain ARSEF 977) TaxID=1276136 RepID=A0A0B4HBJ5_METGA|nr:peptide alpha-N-acetyltransferase [Metarhizium guizhouense ARSEF 977]